jgi:membrane protein DedA with SNARE-associated domain
MTETSAFLARHFVSYASRDLMEAVTHAVLGLVRTHTGLMLPIVFCLAFGESLAFISLLLPATVILVAVGGLIGAANLTFWPLWGAAAAGAAVGDWVSYWLGLHYQASIANTWPLSRHPALLTKGHAFFARWGTIGVFVGRFFGPLRCIVPLVAGACAMKQIPFQIANIASAALWAAVVLAPGWAAAAWLLQ